MAQIKTEALPKATEETRQEHLDRMGQLASPASRIKEREGILMEAEKYRKVWLSTGGKADKLEEDARKQVFEGRRQGSIRVGRYFGELLSSKRYMLVWENVQDMATWLGCTPKTLHQWRNATQVNAFALYEAKPELTLLKAIAEAKDSSLSEEDKASKIALNQSKTQQTIDNQYSDIYNRVLGLPKVQQMKFCQRARGLMQYFIDSGEVEPLFKRAPADTKDVSVLQVMQVEPQEEEATV